MVAERAVIGSGKASRSFLRLVEERPAFDNLSLSSPEAYDRNMEDLRLVRSEILQTELTLILERLRSAYKRTYGKDAPEARIEICDAEGLLSSVVDSPIVLVDRQVFSIWNTYDELAFVLGHELAHKIFAKEEWKGSSSSVPEEVYADRMGQKLAIEAGYSWLGGAASMRALMTFDDCFPERVGWTLPSFLLKLTKEHLEPETRLSQLEKDFVGIERLGTGNQVLGTDDSPLVPLPVEWKEEAARLRHVSWFDKVLQAEGYQEMALAQKLHFLAGHFFDIINTARAVEYRELVGDLMQKFSGAKIPPDAVEAAHHLFDLALDNGLRMQLENRVDMRSVSEAIFYSARSITHPEVDDPYKVPPIGQLRELESAVFRFKAAGTAEEAQASARAFLARADLVTKVRREMLGLDNYECVFTPLDLPEIPDLSDRRMRWASEDTSGDMYRFLEVVGYEYSKERLMDAMPLPFLEEVIKPDARYMRRRRQLEKMTFPMDRAEVDRSPVRWAARYHSILCTGTTEYSLKPLSRFDPYSGKTEAECNALHREAWKLLCGSLHESLGRGDKYARLVAKRSLAPLASTGRLQFQFQSEEPHPYAVFLKAHPELYPIQQRVRIIASIVGWARQTETICDFASVKVPRSPQELLGFLEETSRDRDGRKGGIYCWSKNTSQSRRGLNELPYAMLTHILADTDTESCIAPEFRRKCIEAIAALPPLDLLNSYSLDLGGAVKSFLFVEYENTGNVESSLVPGLSPELQIQAYQYMSDFRTFPDQRVRRAWGEQLCDAIEAESSPERRLELYREVLDNNRLRATRIQDIEIRRRLVKGCADTFTGLFGLDHGSGRYRGKVVDWAEGMEETLSRSVFGELCQELAKSICAQRKLAYELKKLCGIGPREVADLSMSLKGFEQIVEETSGERERRRAFIRWITSDGNEEDTEEFRKELNTWYDKKRPSLYRRFLEDVILEHLDSDHTADIKRILKAGDDHWESLERMALFDIHASFWDLPLAARTLLFRHFLIPPVDEYEDADAAYMEGRDLVLDRLFALDSLEEGSPERRQMIWARTFVETFLDVSHESERALILAALLGAAQIAGRGGVRMSPGKVLNAILSSLGPAYVKLGQAIYAYPNTPEELKSDLEGLTTLTNEPLRWEFWELFDETVPKAEQKRIRWIGKIVGAASFNIIALSRNRLGQPEAFALLRKHALQQGLKGFDTLEDVACVLSLEDADLSRFRQDALNIIRHARELTAIETDNRIGAKQAVIQKAQYQGVRIRVGAEEFHLNPVAWKRHGEGWRRMSVAAGLPFNQLPESTEEERAHKSRAATAIFIAELVNILRGRQIDYDRHAGQYTVDGDDIYPVDCGGMSIERPPVPDRRLFGWRIGRLVGRLASEDCNVEEVLAAFIGEAGFSDHMQRVRRSLLSLGFTFKQMDKDNFKSAFMAALGSGEVDPLIMQSIRDGLREEGISVPDWMMNQTLLRAALKGKCAYTRSLMH